jgi:hypothetical protein
MLEQRNVDMAASDENGSDVLYCASRSCNAELVMFLQCAPLRRVALKKRDRQTLQIVAILAIMIV